MLRLATCGSVLLGLVAALGTDGACSPVTFLQRSTYKRYVALGDSYAAGLGSLSRLRPCADNESSASPDCTTTGESPSLDACDKDSGSYAWQFAKTYVPAGGFQFPACSAADTSAVTQTQLQYLTPDLDLVTLQVGGDDYTAFSNVITNCLEPQWYGDCPGAVADATDELESIIANVKGVLSQVNASVSSATTKALVGYARFFGEEQDCTIEIDYKIRGIFPWTYAYPSLENRQLVNSLIVKANQALMYAASEYNFLFVNADPLFETHRWCDVQSPWWIISTYEISGSDTAKQPYTEVAIGHPSSEGQQAYLRALVSALRLS